MPCGPDWWLSGKKGSLAPLEQAKVWALLVVSRKRALKLSDADVAAEVVKVGGGHPTKQAIQLLRQQLETDLEWYPGKLTENAGKRGPKTTFTSQKRRAVARSAMAVKAAGEEPSVAAIIARCPKATWNPRTKAPYAKERVLEVFRTECYDKDPEHPWQHVAPLQKTALSTNLKEARVKWGTTLLEECANNGWYARHCIWIDPCSTIVTSSPKAAFDEQQARHGKGPRWMSEDSRLYSRNLRASPYAGKQERWGDKRQWWFVVLFRGLVHFEFMPDGWEQTGDGMAHFIAKLPGILASRLGDDAMPRVIFSDRGPGFYQSSSGHIVATYAQALQAHGFRPFAGSDASGQPPDVPDVLLHETVVGWTRSYLKKHPAKRSTDLAANVAGWREAMAECRRHLEAERDIDDPCRSFPGRLRAPIASRGERLKH